MFTGMKEILIQATQLVYGNLLTVKKGFVAGFSAKTNNEAVVVV
jgi:hypothetical protein